ncbi:MAG TPA: patatin-like phospholipase family protein [Candidatus Paceibacterota bacterium]|nr:patatin-like phospholipase family protein [Candidatus Paceibacterota bacterium]
MKKNKRRGITVVLSGGGAKGLAHIGVLEILDENKIPIKKIVGTSAGALIGGMYCAGKLNEAKEMFLNLKKKDVFKMLFSLPSYHYMFNSRRVDEKLKDFTKDLNIEDLKTDFIAVGFNLSEQKKIIFNKGSLFNAIRSSISIPGFFEPFKLGESLIVDGGVSDILPVSIARKYDKKGKIIAVNVEANHTKELKNFSFFNVANYSNYFQNSLLSKFQEEGADVVIRPHVKVSTFDFYEAKHLIAEGRRSAKRALPKIREILKKQE